ncbi:MAG: dTDP-4-dehydrorhamnose 3,5-epimerase [Actinobacteria bacterium]|nr:dTDP-4-dehydrorhamnose 3,5-epimerase [Actinomycetota bacterium]
MGPLLIEPQIHRDDRGFFVESFNEREFAALVGEPVRFVQENHSRSVRGVVRGLHYQLPPAAQAKLVRVVRGAIYDVVVDLRRSSPTCGQWQAYVLSEEELAQLWIPSGFAHGFMATGEVTDVVYKTTDYYAPDLERCVRWDDPEIGIDWPLDGMTPVVSAKDRSAPGLSTAEMYE